MLDSSTVVSSSFHQFGFASPIARGIEAAGFTRPWPIQVAAIPSVLSGRDVLGLAQTGTGKTAAFALPILERLLAAGATGGAPPREARRAPRTGPRVLILAPTRELATQIDAEIRVLAQFTRTKTVLVYGGVSQRPQVEGLRRRPDIVVACPGRLLDLASQREVDFSAIETLVLDEADHMFDMGFLPDIRRILGKLPSRRQNLLFSATMPREIRGLADEVLVDPVVVDVDRSKPLTTIEHALYPIEETRKVALLEHLLTEEAFVSAIVFTRTKHRAKRLGKQLATAGHRAVALQGNMSQSQRDKAMTGFREGRFNVLVATDIVARGIDVARVSHVINFDVPTTALAYTHRIGRTGRAERSGKAYTFVTGNDHAIVRDIERGYGSKLPTSTVEGFASAPISRSEHPAHPPRREWRPRQSGRRFGGHARRSR